MLNERTLPDALGRADVAVAVRTADVRGHVCRPGQRTSDEQSAGDHSRSDLGQLTPPLSWLLRTYRSGGVDGGGRRWRVDCSYEYASLINAGSAQARPKNVIPAGSKPPRVYPIGT